LGSHSDLEKEGHHGRKTILIKPLEDVVPIAKPSAFDLDKFKSKRAAAVANVETLANRLAASQHFAGERLRPATPGGGKLLVA
jgi:hypothetical protein